MGHELTPELAILCGGGEVMAMTSTMGLARIPTRSLPRTGPALLARCLSVWIVGRQVGPVKVPFGPLRDDPQQQIIAPRVHFSPGKNVGPQPAAILGIVAAGLLAGCAAPTPGPLIIANRSDATLTVGPGLVVPACGSTTTTIADYEAARRKGQELAVIGQTWDAPDGALMWTFEALSTAGGVPTGAFTFVVSSSADPDLRIGTVAEDALPTCGGQPRGIQPGTPQGADIDQDLFRDTYAATPQP